MQSEHAYFINSRVLNFHKELLLEKVIVVNIKMIKICYDCYN